MKLPNRLKNAIAERKEFVRPPLGRLIILVLAGLTLYITLAWIAGPESQKSYNFVDERGSVTVLSALFFAMAGSFAIIAFVLSKNNVTVYRFFWLLAAIVFLFFAFDELLRFHEAMGWVTKQILGSSQTFRNWNDLIVIGYGIAGIVCLIVFLPEILRYPQFLELLLLAFLFYAIHTAIDAAIAPRTVLSGVVEESAKLFCAAFLVLSMFTGLLCIISKERNDQTHD